jgi:glycosyltransferase involved in cell wall biosynthesis
VTGRRGGFSRTARLYHQCTPHSIVQAGKIAPDVYWVAVRSPSIYRPALHHIMRIGQFSDSLPPIINGVSAFVAEHHSQLLAQSHDAHAFTFGYTRTKDAQPNVWRTPGVPIFASGFRMGLGLNAQSHRAANQLEVYHAHEPFFAGLQALRYAKWHRRPFIFTNHTRHDIYLRNYPRITLPISQHYIFRFIITAINNSLITTAPSEETAQWLRELAPEWYPARPV